MKNLHVMEAKFKGTDSMDSIALNATDISDQSDGVKNKVRMTTAAAHNLTAGGLITPLGLTNYTKTMEILAVPTSTTLDVSVDKYVAEKPGGTETLRVAIRPGRPFELLGFDLHLNTACATVEDLTLDLDADFGATHDFRILTQAMNTVKDLVWRADRPLEFFNKDDQIVCAWANGNSRTWGARFIYRFLDF